MTSKKETIQPANLSFFFFFMFDLDLRCTMGVGNGEKAKRRLPEEAVKML